MTELRPVDQYHANQQDGRNGQAAAPALPPEYQAFIEELRRSYITGLRACDTILGRPQTIPERDRAR